MSDCTLEVRDLDKSLGKVRILHGINFTVGKGQVCGLIGQNGAGKTTLLRLISGLMKPTGGSITIHTNSPFVGYMPQSCRFDDHRSVADTIGFFAGLKEANINDSLALCHRLGLDTAKKVKHLSPGQQKKLQIVIAMAGDPDLFILDEPTAGLDPKATSEMMEIIKSIRAAGRSILISSHILGDMNEICTHIAIIEKGRLVHFQRLEESYIVKTSPVPLDVLATLQSKYSLQTNEDNSALTVTANRDVVSELVKDLSAHSVAIFGVAASNLKNVVHQQIDVNGRDGY